MHKIGLKALLSLMICKFFENILKKCIKYIIYNEWLYILHNFNVFIRYLHRININTLLTTRDKIGSNIFILQIDFFSLIAPLEKFSVYNKRVVNVAKKTSFMILSYCTYLIYHQLISLYNVNKCVEGNTDLEIIQR